MGEADVSAKPRVRVQAGTVAFPAGTIAGARPGASDVARPKAGAGYLRDTRSAILSTRPSYVRDHREEVRRVWQRAAGIAADILQNSGRLRGARDQVIADTVGVELILNPQPDLSGLGYDDQEKAAFVREIKQRWKRWAWNPRECDLRGKFTLPQQIDMALTSDMVFGEVVGRLHYMPRAMRRQYGIRSGTKFCLMQPTTLVQDTSEYERLFQGVVHDMNWRPVAYRFEEKEDFISVKRDYPAFDAAGRQVVVHVFDPIDPTDVRGISRMAPAFRKHLQHETLVDATIQTQILQTIFAAALTSASPSKEAFEAIEALPDTKDGGDLAAEFMDYFAVTLGKARDGEISISGDPRISHLAPGEELKLLSTGTPGPQFLPVDAALSRDMARAIGVSYGGFTMDHTSATYSSVRMDNSTIWPVVIRRRERIAAPTVYPVYESWLDEEIGEGRLPFKGGYAAFAANRDKVCYALFQGPAKPTADDGKSAKASTERLVNGTSTLAAECAELGYDPDEVFEQRKREHDRYVAAGMPSPFVPKNSGKESAAEPPAKEKAAA